MTETYEICGFCEYFAPSSTMATIYANDPHGTRVRIRVCSRCRSPTLTYIQSAAGFTHDVNVPQILVGAIAVIIIWMGLIFGLAIGQAAGFAIMVTCSLVGAGMLAMEAVSQCIRSS